MNKSKRQMFIVAGVIGAVTGTVLMIPSVISGNYLTASVAALLLMAGTFLIALSFGD